jgi:hypothetical protein
MVESLTDAFFRRVSFVGMGGIEFKRDPRTGEFLMIEPTAGRIDAQEEVATLHGANIPVAAYSYEAGLTVPSSRRIPFRPSGVIRGRIGGRHVAGAPSWRRTRKPGSKTPIGALTTRYRVVPLIGRVGKISAEHHAIGDWALSIEIVNGFEPLM